MEIFSQLRFCNGKITVSQKLYNSDYSSTLFGPKLLLTCMYTIFTQIITILVVALMWSNTCIVTCTRYYNWWVCSISKFRTLTWVCCITVVQHFQWYKCILFKCIVLCILLQSNVINHLYSPVCTVSTLYSEVFIQLYLLYLLW